MFAQNRLDEAIHRLQTRRSVKAMDLQEPGPSPADLNTILECAVRVPDHGKLGPWRFIRFTGDSRAAFGEILAQRYASLNPQLPEKNIEFERQRFLRAPAVVAVIAAVRSGLKIPEWEQQLSVGAACQNALVAACMMGYAGQWLTEWYAFDDVIDEALGLADHERVAGYLYFGSASAAPPERQRPNLSDVLSDWQMP